MMAKQPERDMLALTGTKSRKAMGWEVSRRRSSPGAGEGRFLTLRQILIYLNTLQSYNGA